MSAITDALAGFLSSADATGVTAGTDKNSSHQQFMKNRLIPLTTKLQREIRGRRFRDVQPALKAAIANLKTFEKETWPPEQDSATASTAAPTAEATAFEKQLQALDQDDGSVATDIEDDNTTITTVEPTAEESSDAERATTTWDIAIGDQGQKLSPKEDAMLRVPDMDDDKNTREPMHESIEEILEVYIAILKHPSKTSKVCEMALECIQILVTKHYISGRAGGRDDPSGSGSQAIALKEQGAKNIPPPSLLHRIMEAVASCSNYNSDVAQTASCKTFRVIITSKKCGVHEGSLLLALRSAFHVYLVAKTASTKDVAKASLIEMLRSVFGRLEEQEMRIQEQQQQGHNNHHHQSSNGGVDEGNGQKPVSPNSSNNGVASSQYHTDGYVLFRALCKLSSKELPGDGEPESNRAGLFSSSPPDPMALNNKVLSLELILAVMEFSGNAFCQGEKFIYLVQNYLCVGLLKNCMSNHTNVAFLSQKIFLLLLYKFKANLKQEIEVFLSNIFLRVLESPNSSFKQKALVLESLRSLCRDPVVLTQIFLNYDCDFDARNLYKDIVHHLTKLSGKSTSMPTSTLTKKEAEETYELSLASVEVLVTIMKAFLKALGLPGGDVGSDESAGERIRGMLSLDVDVVPKSDEGNTAKSTNGSNASGGEDSESETSVGKAAKKPPPPPVTSKPIDSESSSKVAGKIVDAFEMKRKEEQIFETGAIKFTLSLKSGLNFFIDNGFVECDANAVALFFLAMKDKLDKTQMGEALGREPDSAFIKGDNIDPEKGGPGFFVRILHHYASALDFTGTPFDDAIRMFLSGFRLPGEAQKIDRIMEKFAEQFTRQNPEVFGSADTAFVLGFSVIMLNTDLHNPSIKPEKKMTMDSFIRNNRGIGENGSDLPTDFLEGIFERIKKNPFSLKEDDEARERVVTAQSTQYFDTSLFFEAPAFFGTSAEERKRERFKKEREEMMAATTQLIRRRQPGKNSKAMSDQSSSLTDSVSPSDVVKPMFDVTWGPVIGILSQVLECSEDERSISVCLNGFVYAIRLASHSHMSLARDTFVTSLAKFTFLGSIKEMKRKNIESIRTLLSIAVIDGEYLGESWGPVLQCTSQLARLRLSASGLDSDESFLAENETPTKRGARNSESVGDGRKTEESNGRAVLEAVNEVLIDKVFSNTVNLSAQSLAHFIEQLITVSTAEINGSSKSGITGVAGRPKFDGSMHGGSAPTRDDGPSIFSLQKLVEVADFNMDVRPRLVWAQMWERMAEFFATISSHENTNVSVYAIDSLKQLSFKFLDKPELSEFNFQRIYLRPFLHVMQQDGTREDIRELVLRCLDNIVRTKSHNLRSGWKIIFAILARSAEDSSEKINFLGLAILQRLLDDHLDELCRLEDENLDEKEEDDPQHHILPAFGATNRSADVEDFVGLCRASSAFVQKKESASPRPMGLSMRALCHTAIYADLLADKRVQPPVSGAQWTDPQEPGYTYAGLDENEALEMVLWRSLLEGLADGIRSKARSSAAGLGCLVQRGSIMALRAIFIRHGSIFSVPQWEAILRETLLPAIQDAAESEMSPVVGITSESPHLSSIDFLADSVPLPPPLNDPGLLKFEEIAMNNESAPSRAFGKAELVLEASFTDMRHGGDGDLSLAYVLAQKDACAHTARDQPFPDSWIATTASLALGLLTDVTSEVFLALGAEGRERLWPLVANQFLVWCVGRPLDIGAPRRNGEVPDYDVWWPCEAIVRVACNEMHRLSERVTGSFSQLYQFERVGWTGMFLTMFADALTNSVALERSLEKDLFRTKTRGTESPFSSPPSSPPGGSETEGSLSSRLEIGSVVDTPFGKGTLVSRRRKTHDEIDGQKHVTVHQIALDFGGTLYQPDTSLVAFKHTDNESPAETHSKPNGNSALPNGMSPSASLDQDASFRSDASKDMYWLDYIPALKIRCVAAHCLQNGFSGLLDRLVPLMEKDVALKVLEALRLSRQISEESARDENLKRMFQEAIFTEWGDGIEEVQMALSNVARMSHLHGSDMFFLTQEAGATRATIQMLGMLYHGRVGEERVNWDRADFAEAHLLGTMKDALRKFQDSEERDGHLVDPNVWRNTSESGGKVALYCTSFADVVVGILSVIHSLDHEKFTKHSKDFFPIVCSLVRAESKEIRNLVQCILAKQVAPMIDVDPDACTERSYRLRRNSDHGI
ncbi:inhibited guanine nucleotide-exchange protein [Seminavis robusta]|uniref:Inhibited guanine nucleotide-exchange protein n=1 Tax=Seminavis robusta TaxID=568900 RepID=A0A9N8DH79_9STRA|nr:inhibited guanine nucleotide-exchange protein [Seminavis robusta]|eukprot:Sro125_g060190.1 inhibited guanine nucleotide-exchange protein (2179) ;mRNA; r:37682-44777